MKWLNGQLAIMGDLDDAEAVIVESGAAVDVEQAAAIQLSLATMAGE